MHQGSQGMESQGHGYVKWGHEIWWTHARGSPGSLLMERRVVRGRPKWYPLESTSQHQSLVEACEEVARSDPDAVGLEGGPSVSMSKAQGPLFPDGFLCMGIMERLGILSQTSF